MPGGISWVQNAPPVSGSVERRKGSSRSAAFFDNQEKSKGKRDYMVEMEMSSTPRFKHCFVLDTSVLIYNPDAIETFGDNIIEIPIHVLEELDVMKRIPDGKGMAARRALRNLDEYRKAGSLKTGAPTRSGGVVRVAYMKTARFGDLPVGLEKTVDNHIILTAFMIQNDKKSGKGSKDPRPDVVLVSKDVNLRIKAEACGLKGEDYRNDKQITNIRDLYAGVVEFEMSGAFDPSVLFQDTDAPFDEVARFVSGGIPNLYANQGCVFRYVVEGNGDRHRRVLAVYNKAERMFRHIKPPHNYSNGSKEPDHSCSGPVNDRQAIAFDHLMNEDVSIATLVGKAGTGKTLLALLAAVRQINDETTPYDQVLIYRPNYEMGKPLGFLPGDIADKYEPWKIPIFDNLLLVCAHKRDKGEKDKGSSAKDTMKKLLESGRVAIEPINFIRGRTLHGKYVIVDEAQNLTPLEVKTVITRIGKGSKLVLTGDPHQIDNSIVDSVSNGLSQAAQKLRVWGKFAHIILDKTERSEIAEVAAELL